MLKSLLYRQYPRYFHGRKFSSQPTPSGCVIYTLSTAIEFREEIKKSKFITIIGPANTEQEARDFLKKYSVPDATHNCWAYRLSGIGRFTDDGEPGGTAGRPMLAALEGQSFDNVVALCIRYYGGINLGAGGLVRAYGGGVAKCLKEAEKEGAKIHFIPTTALECKCTYSQQSMVRQRVIENGGSIIGEDLDPNGEGITLYFSIPTHSASQLINLIEGGNSLKVNPTVNPSLSIDQ